MAWQFTPYVLTMLVAAATSAGLALLIWQRIHTITPFVVLVLAIAFWALVYALELSFTDFSTKLFLGRLTYLGIVTVPVAWFAFVLRYIGRGKWLTLYLVGVLAIVPLVTLALTWTGAYRPLIWRVVYLDTRGPSPLLAVRYGPWWWIFVVYAYGLLLSGSIMLVGWIFRSPNLYRCQALSLLFALILPWVGNAVYLFDLGFISNLDLTPAVFTLTCLIVMWALWRYRLFDIVPIARDVTLANMSDGVFVLDVQGRFVDANPAACRVIGVPCVQLVGRYAAEALTAWPDMVSRYCDVTTAHTEISLDVEAVPCCYDLRISPLHNLRNRLVGRLFVLRDITERKRAEAELRSSERFLALLNDITRAALEMPDMPSMLQVLADRLGDVIGADGCYLTFWDDAASKTIPVAAYGETRETYGTEVAVPGEKTMTESVLRAGHPLVAEDVYNTPYLSRHIAEMYPDRSLLGLPLIVGKQKLGALLIAFNEPHHFTPDEIAYGERAAQHITLAVAKARLLAETQMLNQTLQDHAKQLEQRVQERTAELHTQYAHLDAILHSVGDAILVMDQDFQIRYTNPAFSQLTGYAQEDVLGQPLDILSNASISAQLNRCMEPALTQDRMWQGEVNGQRKDGSAYVAAMILTPVRDADSEIIGCVASQRDISQIKALERARNQFIANVSHEFRTPVTTLQLYTHLIKNETLPPRAQQYLQAVESQTTRLIQLIQDTLEITALDAGKTLTTRKLLSVSDLVTGVVAAQQALAVTSGLTLTVAPFPLDLPPVEGDKARLVQAFDEILRNAITFTPAGGAVMMTVRETEWHEICIAVQDTGPGIAPEEQNRVFDRFFRGALAESGHIPGTGLGLSIAREIVQAHGGKITLESELEAGSTFTIWLPALTSCGAATSDADPEGS